MAELKKISYINAVRIMGWVEQLPLCGGGEQGAAVGLAGLVSREEIRLDLA